MKRVCLNRLKNEALALSNQITSLDTYGSSLIQEVFDSIFKLCHSEKQTVTEPIQTQSTTAQSLNSYKRNSKEVLKMVVGLMIEDIWQNFDNYKIQQQILLNRQPKHEADFLEEPLQKLVELRRQNSSTIEKKQNSCTRSDQQKQKLRGNAVQGHRTSQSDVELLRKSTTDSAQKSHKTRVIKEINLVSKELSLVSPADLCDSEDSQLHPDRQENKLKSGQAPVRVNINFIQHMPMPQASQEDLEKLLRLNIQEFENNQLFKRQLDAEEGLKTTEHLDLLEKNKKQFEVRQTTIKAHQTAKQPQTKYIDDFYSDEEQSQEIQEVESPDRDRGSKQVINRNQHYYQTQSGLPNVLNVDTSIESSQRKQTNESVSDTKSLKDPNSALDKYANLPFVPQKNEETDKRDILHRSKEFNPVISFPIAAKQLKKPQRQERVLRNSQLESQNTKVSYQTKKSIKSFVTYGSTNYGITTGTYTKPGIPSSGSAGKK